MEKKLSLTDALIYRVLGYFFIVSMIKNISELLWYPWSIQDILVWTLIIYVIYNVIFINKWSFFIFISICLLGIVIWFIWAVKTENLEQNIRYLNNIVSVLKGGILHGLGIKRIYQPYILGSLAFLLAGLFHILAIKYRAFGILTIIGITLFAINNEFGTLSSKYLLFVLLAVQMMIYFMNIMKKYEGSHVRKFYTQGLTAISCTVIFILITFILGTRFNDPLSFFENSSTIDILDRRSNEGNQKLLFVDSERLVDSVHVGTTVVLKVESDKSVYLRGIVLNSFDGLTWQDTNVSGLYSTSDKLGEATGISRFVGHTLDEQFDTLGFSYFIFGYDDIPSFTYSDEMAEYYMDQSVSITYQNLYSDVLFSPLNSYVLYASGIAMRQDGADAIKADHYLEKNFSYEVDYLMPIFSSDLVIELMRQTKSRAMSESSVGMLSDLSSELALPETTTDRTIELAYELTKDYDNTYDKAKAIEAYLKSNYNYKLENLTLPEIGGDFVDYFLFESTEGYCTYFASAMAVMLRSQGIPSRLVKGYVAKKVGTSVGGQDSYEELKNIPTENNSGNEILVKDKDAHAWVEAYIEGFGWVPFEPTSGYQLYASETDKTPLEIYQELIDKSEKPETPVVPEQNEVLTTSGSIVEVAGIWLIGIIVLIYLIYFSVYRLKKKRYSLKSITEKLRIQHGLILLILKNLCRQRRDNETLKQYYDELKENVLLKYMSLEDYYALVEQLYYSNDLLSEEDYEKSMGYYNRILKIYKEKYRFKYLYFRLRYHYFD